MTIAVRIACWHGTDLCRRQRGSDHHIRTRQTYHQDQHPDRMLHGVFLLNADPLGAGILLATNYIGSVNRF
jgi:hypothetical protein